MKATKGGPARLDMDLFWATVNSFLTPELLRITQKVHFFSHELVNFESREEIRPEKISERDCRLALSEAYSELGEALIRMDRLDLAHISCLYAVELDVRNFLAFYHLGTMARRADHLPFAIRSFKLALDIHPDHDPSFLEIGECFEITGDSGQAIRALEAVRPEAIEYPRAQLGLFRLLGRTGQKERGLTLLEGHRARGRLKELHERLARLLDGEENPLALKS